MPAQHSDRVVEFLRILRNETIPRVESEPMERQYCRRTVLGFDIGGTKTACVEGTLDAAIFFQ